MGTVKKTYQINALPDKVYKALVKREHIKSWSGDDAQMNVKSGSRFSLWGGSIYGINIEVTPKCIIQDWKEDSWDNFSKVTFFIRKRSGGTELELIHDDIPEESVDDIDSGWDEHYLRPLQYYVEKKFH